MDVYKEYLDTLRSQGKISFSFAQILGDLKVDAQNIRAGLYRCKKEGRLISPAKGLYIIVPPEDRPYGSIPAEELVPILMRYLNLEYYVSLLSAAAFYGAAHQKVASFQIITTKQLRHPMVFGRVKINAIYKKKISGLPLRDFKVATGYLKVASPELVAFDLFKYPLKSAGLNHIATVLYELNESLDPDKLIELAESMATLGWLQRFGYILGRVGSMDEEKARTIIDKLQGYLSGKYLFYVPLASEMPRRGYPYIKKWKIIENIDIESDL